jgi:hypothetical protein
LRNGVDREIAAQVFQRSEAATEQLRKRLSMEVSSRMLKAFRMMEAADDVSEWRRLLMAAGTLFVRHTQLWSLRDGLLYCEALQGPANYEIPVAGTPLGMAPAMANALESDEPLGVLATPENLSATMLDMLMKSWQNEQAPARVVLLPLRELSAQGSERAARKAPCVLLAAPEVDDYSLLLPQLECFALAAGSSLSLLRSASAPTTAPAGAMLSIATAASFVAAPLPLASEAAASTPPPDLPKAAAAADLDRSLLDQQRFARARVAAILLFEERAAQAGRDHSDIYAHLQWPIEAARKEFTLRFGSEEAAQQVLHRELVQQLAMGNAALLGAGYWRKPA